MKRIILEIGDGGSVYAKDGSYIGFCSDDNHFGESSSSESANDIDNMVKLKLGGFTASDLVELKNNGII